ncbi:MAG: lysylphosphatidylglycerol synthase transmembrane domain-containing protein [Anaerolineaceae bacterium]|jgi:uncharacterized membrane protein YbhN (UPF0104 family)|nr:lysylphosphatidylglycerol synthase transmembrane domain-containing protein [Anaerolineaceae bacterium]
MDTTKEQHPPLNNKTRFQKAWKIFKILLAILLISVVLSKTNWTQLKALRTEIVWVWLIAYVLLYSIMTLVKALQYKILIGRNIKYKEVLRIVIWQNAISNFLATSAGIASFMAMLKTEKDIKITQSGATFILTKFGDLLVLSFYLAISASIVWQQIEALRFFTILLLGALLIALGIFLCAIFWRKRFVSLLRSVLVRLKLTRFSLVTRSLAGVETLISIPQRTLFKLLGLSISTAFLYMTVTMGSVLTSLRMFDVQLSLFPVIYVASLMQLVSFVPVQILGGLGVTEVTSVYLFQFFGLEQSRLFAVMLGNRVIYYLINLVIFLYIPLCSVFEKRDA